MRLSTLFGVAITTLVASFASANAQERIQIGVLECDGGQNVGFVVGSVTSLQCVFQGEGRRPEAYVATIHRFGVDLGFTQQTKFSWAAYGPTNQIAPGGLAGRYGGVGANASVGVGFGGNFLLGGVANSYVLQPVSVQGQTGLNVAAGVADVELEPVVTRVGLRRHHHYIHHRHHRHRGFH
jgi:Protein of unknown function (DUF992)